MPKGSPDSDTIVHSLQQPNYRKTVLPNGLRIVSEEIPYVRSISVGVWINVGSRDEDEDNNGISHFLEHMVFKGTKRFTSQQIAKSLETVGGYLNAFTTKEHTCFYARVLDDHLQKAIDVLSDMVQYPLFEPKEMDKEKSVILEELKNLEDDPDDLIHDYFDRTVFQRHPLAFPIIGKAKNVQSFDRADLLAHTRRHYAPGRMVVSTVGNLRHERLVDLVGDYFSGNDRRSSSSKRLNGPRQSRSRREVFDKPILQAHVCVGTIGYGLRSRLRYPLLVLNTILGEGMSSRLFQNIREKYGFAYNVYSFANLLSDTGNFGVYVGTDGNNIERSIELIHRELAKLSSTPVSKAELQRAKAQLKGTLMLSLESMSSRMMRLGSGELYFGEYLPLEAILRSIDAVEPEQVQEIANNIFQPGKLSIVILQPAKTNKLPSK